jgi:hypothetical protein
VTSCEIPHGPIGTGKIFSPEFPPPLIMSRDSAVGITTGYGLDGLGIGVRVLVGARLFCYPRCSDRFSAISNGYGGLFPPGKAAGA